VNSYSQYRMLIAYDKHDAHRLHGWRVCMPTGFQNNEPSEYQPTSNPLKHINEGVKLNWPPPLGLQFSPTPIQ